MVVEAADPVPWTKPEDLPYDEGKPLPKLGGQFEDGFYAAFTDGWPRFLSREVAPETLRALIRRGDGEVNTFDEPGPWRRLIEAPFDCPSRTSYGSAHRRLTILDAMILVGATAVGIVTAPPVHYLVQCGRKLGPIEPGCLLDPA